jgi:hypothetical protein
MSSRIQRAVGCVAVKNGVWRRACDTRCGLCSWVLSQIMTTLLDTSWHCLMYFCDGEASVQDHGDGDPRTLQPRLFFGQCETPGASLQLWMALRSLQWFAKDCFLVSVRPLLQRLHIFFGTPPPLAVQ